jgi:hypothetical protein
MGGNEGRWAPAAVVAATISSIVRRTIFVGWLNKIASNVREERRPSRSFAQACDSGGAPARAFSLWPLPRGALFALVRAAFFGQLA